MLEGFDKAFENKARLGIMAVLMNAEEAEFAELKAMLDLSDGNLSSHLSYLENCSYIKIRKSFVGRKPNTRVAASNKGIKAFTAHLNALEKLLKH
jgi:DNA-binding transcriptional ArsR family regulator